GAVRGPRLATEQDIVSAGRQPLVGDHLTQTGHGSNGWPLVVIAFPATLQQDEGDHPVTGQGVFEHVAVAGLKDGQRLHNVRKHHQIWQREQPHRPRRLSSGCRILVRIAHGITSFCAPYYRPESNISSIRSSSSIGNPTTFDSLPCVTW